MNHYQRYCENIPTFLLQAAAAPEILRLQDVGMNCGCEYTSFPRFQNLDSYSRYDHSLGVALIIWRFTHDPAQTLAGLLHDIATPVFAHVVDFLRGDYLTQEATESGTVEMIASSDALRRVLTEQNLTVDDVCDYHRYPIADNDAPRLAADRLEYTLGNCLNYGIRDAETVWSYYQDLIIALNEENTPELAFHTKNIAEDFALAALSCSKIYVADEDRYSMQILSELLKHAIQSGVLEEQDLRTTETVVVKKLLSSADTAEYWQSFRSIEIIERSEQPRGDGWRKIVAKKRRIDPLIIGLGRVSKVSNLFSEQYEAFLNRSQDYWIRGIKGR